MHQLVEIASYPGNPPTCASTIVFDEFFSSVTNRFWFCSAHKIVISCPPGPRALASLRLALTGSRRAHATAGGLACVAESMGWGAITREGRVA